LHSFGRSIIVLNSNQAATDLLDKRGTNYSDRPKMLILEMYVPSNFALFFELLFTFFFARMGWFPTLAFLPYGKLFLRHRKMFQHHFGPRESLAYLPIQRRQANMLARSLMMETPKHTEHTGHLSRRACVTIHCVVIINAVRQVREGYCPG
jgi:hypothetical protein